jgi:E2/UBC family protein D
MRNENAPAAAAPPIRGLHSLEFFDGQILFRSRNGAGEQFKFLNPAAVAAAFKKAPIDSGWLPPGVVRCGHTPIGDFAVLYVPARLTRIEIEGRKRPLDLHLPAFVFLGIGRSFYVWTTVGRELNPKERIHVAPLPNVFGDGRICWGANKPPRASAATIGQTWNLFITSPFSDHANNDKARGYETDVRPLLVSLARSRRKFPERILIARRESFDHAITQIIGGTNIADDE